MLQRLPEEQGRWYVSPRLSELDVACEWGIPPHIWDAYPEESRAEMIARARVRAGMQRYNDWKAEQDRLRNQPPGKR